MIPGTRAIMPDKVTFRRRTERLDWRKVASIDIDSLIQDGDANRLEEWIQPVTFCKADSEFDLDKLDPGFIKVFRLSQLISECLLVSQEKCAEKLTKLEDKYNDTEKEKDKLFQEILHLKVTLTSAKKELKKRKEMLASSQNEMLGQNNADEYDQCPYCTKRFLTSNYLLAHIQRRHQGLPINPLYSSYHPGATVAQHQHHQTLVNLPQHPSGSHESHGSRALQHVAPINQQPFPINQTPSSLLYGINQLCQNNQSYSGSVVSLNQIPPNNMNVTDPTGSAGFCRRDSFTQTPIANTGNPDETLRERFLETKPAGLSLGLADVSKPHQSENQTSLGTAHQLQIPQDESNEELAARFSENAGQPSFSSPLPPALDDRTPGFSYSGDGGAGGGSTVIQSSSKSRERVEAAELDVMRMQDEFESHWQNLSNKVRQSGIEELKGAMIPEVTMAESFPINLSNEEAGEVPKSPIVNHHTQLAAGGGGDSFQKQGEPGELKRLLQAAVHDELHSLVSRLESQEQFWQQRLASVEQSHENQIEQLRQELQLKNRSMINNNAPATQLQNQASPHVNENVMVADKSQFGDEQEEDSENVQSSGFILVGPKGHHKPNSWHPPQHTSSPSPSGGAPRDLSGESKAPVAKPRKSTEPVFHSAGTGEGDGSFSTGIPSPIPTTFQPIIHLKQRDESRGAPAQLQSLSESEPEYLTIIQPEEFHEEKHDNSIQNPRRVTIAANKNSQPFLTARMGSGFPEMTKSGDGTELKSDEVSDYTLSDSVDEGDDEQNNARTMSFRTNDSHHQHHQESIDHPRGKSSAKQTPVKKKYIFDAQARKIVEVSPDDDDDEEDDDEDVEENYEHSGRGDLNNDDDDNSGKGKKGRKSQLDLVRAKTIMELEQQMTDIGLNPESTAIGLEEMGRALKHLKLQRRESGSQAQDYEKFEEERNAVKTLAKFEATKSSIDGKLDAISTLNTNKAPQSSFVKIFSAVKTSGKNFRKRVASAVKKKPKSGDADDAEEKISKRKSASAPPLKTTFFSKARWARRKKSEGANKPPENVKDVGENTSDDDVTTDESSEEIELPPFMTRSKTIPLKRNSNESTEMLKDSSRRKLSRSNSKPKSAKPLKRLNSNNSNNRPILSTVPLNLFDANVSNKHGNNNAEDSPSPTQQNSSASPPFSNVDENDYDMDEDDLQEEEESEKEDEGRHLGNHQSNQNQGQRGKEHKDLELERHIEKEKAVINELTGKFNGKTRSKAGERDHLLSTTQTQAGKKHLSSPSSPDVDEESEPENWDNEDDDNIQSFESSIRKQKNNFVNTLVSANKESDFDDEEDDNDDVQRISPHRKTNTLVKGKSSGRWNERSMETSGGGSSAPSWAKISEDRLQEIKQMIRRNKKEIGSETSSSEDADDDEKDEDKYGESLDDDKPAKERKRNSVLKEPASDENNQFKKHTRSGSDLQPYDRMSQDRVISTGLTATAKTTPKVRPQTARQSQNSLYDVNDDELSQDDSSFGREIRKHTNDILAQGQQQNNDGGDVTKYPGSLETKTRKQNSSEEIEDDIRELLNTTVSDEEENYLKNPNSRKIPQATSSSKRGNLGRQQFSTMQPTQHETTKLSYRTGVANRGKQHLQDKGRKSPSNNSWDSWNSTK